MRRYLAALALETLLENALDQLATVRAHCGPGKGFRAPLVRNVDFY